MRSIIFILICVSMIIAEKNIRGTKHHDEVSTLENLEENEEHVDVTAFLSAPGGDDHDEVAFKIGQLREFLTSKSIEEIREYCLKLEQYLRDNLKESTMGGIHDYIRTLDKEGCLNFIFMTVLENKELLEKSTFESVVTSNKVVLLTSLEEDEEEDDDDRVKIEEFKKYLYTNSVEYLREFALNLIQVIEGKDMHVKISNVKEYVKKLNKKDCIDFIVCLVFRKGDLLEKSTPKNALMIEEDYPNLMMINSIEPTENEHEQEGGLSDFIFRMDRETLVAWALSFEKYDKERTGSTVDGGLHDKIDKMTDIELAEYILEKSKIYKELDSYPKLTDLSVRYGFAKNLVFLFTEGKLGGLHDYIYSQDRETLVSWALAAEKYSFNGKSFVGGIHDIIGNMSDSDLANYVLKKTNEFPELDNYEKISELSIQYGFGKKKDKLVKNFGYGGLHDYIFRQPRETLVRWAFTCEKHHRTVKNIMILGGLEDYIEKLSDKEIAEYILKEAEEHKELDSSDHIEKLATEYGFSH